MKSPTMQADKLTQDRAKKKWRARGDMKDRNSLRKSKTPFHTRFIIKIAILA
jgi:hypothetical protein